VNHLVGDRSQNSVEFIDGQELEIRICVGCPSPLGSGGLPDRILSRPAPSDCVLEDRVEKRENVSHSLRRSARAEHVSCQSFDARGGDLVDWALAEGGMQMHSLHGLAVLQIGLARALEGELAAK
jgi:hypothetical protein